ncbi:nucleoside deaminase [Pantoea sp. At-9b]|uniref:nucleoside deaminase n=1 Tax=Pantoea sp. (strain At-9b) TaxID=592316 RepID=UPI0001B3EE1B|nr:nucleoside deaminase [Pantoea sp. At-9b]ADU72012.1 CMP/dCMP deaminase zinc-binding protein [Pantoea sp. At-9b]
MINDHDIHFLRLSNEVGRRAIALGKHPFGAVLVAPDQQTVLLTQCNIDTVNHAESTLARIAATNFSAEYLWQCTLYTAVEPCCMCAGTIYWANIGRVVFGMSETRLLACTGSHEENPTMSLSAATVFAHGQKAIRLVGPVDALDEETFALQRSFWRAR